MKHAVCFDIHTHTKYSDGKSTVQENIAAAKQKGIRLGISDHGPGHRFFGITKQKQKLLLSELEAYNAQTEQAVLLGIEANLLDDGQTDLGGLIYEPSYVILGYHKGALTPKLHFLSLGNKQKRSHMLTDFLIRAMEDQRIDIIAHPGQYIPVELAALSEAAAHYGVLIEVNERHFMTALEIEIAAKNEAFFLLSSDAHRCEAIAEMPKCFAETEKAGLPETRIVNHHAYGWEADLRINKLKERLLDPCS